MTLEVTQLDILDGLHRLGAQPTSHLMVHGSLSQFGRVAGGAVAVVAALRAAAGPTGAVIAPSFRDAIRSDYYGMRECVSVCPQSLCASRERGFTGAIGEAVRELPDALRSCHPTHSWVGVGAGARDLLDGHCQSLTPCGHESPFFRVLERGGQIVLLGVGVNSITSIHAVEDAINAPYLSAIDRSRRHATYSTSGRRIQYCYPRLLQAALQQCGLIRTTQIGAAQCHALSSRKLASFLWQAIQDDPWCLVLRPRGDRYDPAEDAQAKTARMALVWNRRPAPAAWGELLKAARRTREPIEFSPDEFPRTDCPAYRGIIRDHHRCAANDLPPWEKFEEFVDEPGVATCSNCNWNHSTARRKIMHD